VLGVELMKVFEKLWQPAVVVDDDCVIVFDMVPVQTMLMPALRARARGSR